MEQHVTLRVLQWSWHVCQAVRAAWHVVGHSKTSMLRVLVGQLAAGECHPECREGFLKSDYSCQKCYHYCKTCSGKYSVEYTITVKPMHILIVHWWQVPGSRGLLCLRKVEILSVWYMKVKMLEMFKCF
jgi:hypothetical protein